jgi:hypothetical protein
MIALLVLILNFINMLPRTPLNGPVAYFARSA